MTRETAILSRRLRGAYHVVVHENDSCRLGHVERSGESLARCRQDFSGGPDRNLVVTEQTTSIVEQEHAEVLAPVIRDQMPFDDEVGRRVRVGHSESRPPVAAHSERDTRSGTVAVVGGAASLVHTERRRPRTNVKNKYQRFSANKALSI